MRRYMQKQLSELLDSMNEAVVYMSNCQDQSKEFVFNDCIEALNAICEIIEDQQALEVCHITLEKLYACMEEVKENILVNTDTKVY